MNENLFEVLRGFRLDAEPVSCEPYGCGHINVTYLAVTASGRLYILQKNQSSHVPRRGRSDGEHHVRHGIPAHKNRRPAQRPDTGQNGGRRKLSARAGCLLARV